MIKKALIRTLTTLTYLTLLALVSHFLSFQWAVLFGLANITEMIVYFTLKGKD